MGKIAARTRRRKAADVLSTIGSAGADPDRFARIGVAELPRRNTKTVARIESRMRFRPANSGAAIFSTSTIAGSGSTTPWWSRC